MKYNCLFGPVFSRRLGRSLGVDLIPFKTCTLNCIYCECGKTTVQTTERRPYVPFGKITAELDHFLAQKPELDYITFAGSGEPTLNSDLGAVLHHLKEKHPSYRTALLTNGTLFFIPEVRAQCRDFDLVLPSLDGVSPEVFSRINDPLPELTAARLITGLKLFADEFTGALWLELFIVPGINDSSEELRRLKNIVAEVNPARLQINTLDRPGIDPAVTAASPERLKEIARFFAPAIVDIVSRGAAGPKARQPAADIVQSVLDTCRRRPGTVQDLSGLTGLRIVQVRKVLAQLMGEKKITEQKTGNQIFYRSV